MSEVRLIDANALKNSFDSAYTTFGQCVYAKEIVDRQPTIEAEPVMHAYWEPSEEGEYHCTNCGIECDVDMFHKALLNLYCGNCGARMDGGADNG